MAGLRRTSAEHVAILDQRIRGELRLMRDELKWLRAAVRRYCDVNEHRADGDIDEAYDAMSEAAGHGEGK